MQDLAEDSEAEVSSDEIYALFQQTYLMTADRLQLGNYQLLRQDGSDGLQVTLTGPGIDYAIPLATERNVTAWPRQGDF